MLDAYLLRSLAVAGYAPSLEECALCGTRQDRRRPALALVRRRRRGTDLPVVRAPGAAMPAAQTVDLMTALLRGDWPAADASEGRHRVECSGLVAAYLQWHLEHSIRSLRHVEHA